MFFADIHTHLLYGADDGPKTPEEMFAIVDKLYSDGVRLVCATPHCHPQWSGDNREQILTAFSELQKYCQQKYPDLKVFLGNELFFGHDGMTWLKNGFCNTLNGTRHVLVEFDFGESEKHIIKAVQLMLNGGYIPVIAHVERYYKLSLAAIKEMKTSGALLQINARKDFCGFDFRKKKRLKQLLNLGLADVVSSDVHDLNARSPYISEFYHILLQKYDKEYLENIFFKNAESIFS